MVEVDHEAQGRQGPTKVQGLDIVCDMPCPIVSRPGVQSVLSQANEPCYFCALE